MADRDYQYREDRHDTDEGATIWRQIGAAVFGTLVNISTKGCPVRHRKTLWVGERVALELHGEGPRPAIVRCSLLGKAGLKLCHWHDPA